MRKLVFAGVVLSLLAGCKSNPHKAEKIETNLDSKQQVSGAQSLGLKNGEMVVQEKSEMNEKLRDLQNQVFALEDKVYGNRKFDTKGLYGELRSCKSKLASRQYGGSGTLVWAEPLDRVTDKEEEMNVGLDEGNKVVGVKEEYLKDRLARFQGYKKILQKREDEFTETLEECKTQMKEKDVDPSASGKKVSITETSKLALERESVSEFMCKFVKRGASLQSLLMNAFGHGWLSVGDFAPDGKILQPTIRDEKGEEKSNGLMLGAWKLAFNEGTATLTDILAGEKDAKLEAWSGSNKCLSKADGRWNP
jgi:hypothetical protein